MSSNMSFGKIAGLVVAVLVGIALVQASMSQMAHHSTGQGQASHPHTNTTASIALITGAPTVTVAQIKQILQAANSPAADTAQALYNEGVAAGINPAFALAVFKMESSFGTQGEARTTLSLGNLRCYTGAACVDQDRGGYAQYASWEDGYRGFYQLVRSYIADGISTLTDFIHRYAPADDNNNEQAYVQSLVESIQSWQTQAQQAEVAR